jgi:hypothetical protein
MPLARFDAPFEHPDWIFEPKLDGFRAVAYIEGGACRLVSRNRNAFKTFEPLAQAIAQELARRSAILDGEIVRPGPDGRPMFYAVDAAARAVLLLRLRSALAGLHGLAESGAIRVKGAASETCSRGRHTRSGMWSTSRPARTCSA